jgi:AraC-like DNA-binding protein
VSELVRQCQLFAGRSAFVLGQQDRKLLVREFLSQLPIPETPFEKVIFSRVLIDVALHWSHQLHKEHQLQYPDPCMFDCCQSLLSRSASNASPESVFADWASTFLDAFDQAHPVNPAVRVKQILDAGKGARVKLRFLARQSGCHSRRLQLIFRGAYGLSIREYQTRRQVLCAARLLATSDEKVDAIARLVGFQSRKNFYGAFHRLVGLTPSSLRHWSSAELDLLEQVLFESKRPKKVN